jgi:hypothetical protein
MPELLRFLWTTKTAGKTVAFGNDPNTAKKELPMISSGRRPRNFCPREVDARQFARRSCVKDHVAGLFDEISITRFKARTLEQARDFRHQTSRVERKFEIIVSAGL